MNDVVTPPPPGGRRSADAAGSSDTRRRILDAAVTCFTRSGFHGTSMHEICAESKLSPGAIYRHFPSKDAIIEAIAGEEREFSREITARLEVATGALDNLFATGFAYMREATATYKGALSAEVFAEAQRNPRIREIFGHCHTEVHASLRRVLERAREEGDVAADVDLDMAVTMIMAIGDGLIVRMPFEPPGAIERIFPAIADMLRRMLAPRGVETPGEATTTTSLRMGS